VATTAVIPTYRDVTGLGVVRRGSPRAVLLTAPSLGDRDAPNIGRICDIGSSIIQESKDEEGRSESEAMLQKNIIKRTA
jgi:hypothetical protein